MKKFFGLCAAIVLVLGAVIFPAKSFAAGAESEGMKAFRQALTQDSDALERIFRQDIFFASPFIISELEIYGMAEDENSFKSSGDFSLWIYNDDGTETEKVIPYYLTQNGNEMTIYFKSDKQWEKFTTPTLAAAVMDMIATPDAKEIEEIIADTKEVTILEDNEYRRIMLIRPDGARMAESLKTKSAENPDEANDPIQQTAMKYLDAALRNADIWYMWTIDKRDWHTVAMQFNFSGIIQELARAALNDPAQTWPDEISNLLETIAYYSEIRAYTTYPADPKAKNRFVIPKNVLKAKEVKNITDNINAGK